MVYAARTTRYMTGDWLDMMFCMLPEKGDTAVAADRFYVAWVGLFESEEQIFSYANYDMPEKEKLLWEFDEESKVNQHVYAQGDTLIGFNAEEKALEVRVADTNGDGAFSTNPGHIDLGVKKELPRYDVNENPVIALRVKLNHEMLGGYVSFRTNTQNAQDYPIARLPYEDTDDWQVLVLDASEDNTMSYFFEGNWQRLSFDFATAAQADGTEVILVDWIGVFDSVESAYGYAGLPVPEQNEDLPPIDSDFGDDEDAPPAEDDADIPQTGEMPISRAVPAAMLISGGLIVAVVLTKARRRSRA